MKSRPIEFRAFDIKKREWTRNWVIDGYGVIQPLEEIHKLCPKKLEDPISDYYCIGCADYTNWRGIEDFYITQWTGLYDCTKWDELSPVEQDYFRKYRSLSLNGYDKWEGLSPDEQVYYKKHGAKKRDWKGRKLFEGDIVKKIDPIFSEYDGAIGIVVYEDIGFFIELIQGDKWSFYYPDGQNWSIEQIKIIGNKFENIELTIKDDEGDY